MTGKEYRDRIAGYIDQRFGDRGLLVYTEVQLGKTIIGKDRKVDVFVVRESDQRALAVECKYQDVQGTTEEKIPYALQDLAALRVGGCLAYAGTGWSPGVLHTLAASPLAAYCMPGAPAMEGAAVRSADTRELDHVVAARFGLWRMILPETRRFRPG